MAPVAVESASPARVYLSDREVVLAHYEQWRRFAAAVGQLDVEPDDLVQEAVARALKRGPLADLDHPGAYVRRSIANLASNRRRSLRRGRLAAAKTRVETSVEQPYPSDLADLEMLKPLERAVLFLADVEGHSFADIAEMLGGSEVSHRLRASRARRKLAHALSIEQRGGQS